MNDKICAVTHVQTPGRPCARTRVKPLVAAGLLLVLTSPGTVRAQGYTLLYSFQCGPNDGAYPSSTVVLDPVGNIYGLTSGGGPQNWGTVFRVAPDGSESVLHFFGGPPLDGAGPERSSLVRDSAGNLYGATTDGGSKDEGIVFKIAPNGQETILRDFSTVYAGAYPSAAPIPDSSGNLFGVTFGGGAYGRGNVYELSRTGQETVLWSFGVKLFGYYPIGGLVRDPAGNLYGTTQLGGTYADGTVFKIDANHQESVLYNFAGPPDGAHPYDTLIRDQAGNLYGTTAGGGRVGAGIVFRLNPTGKETVIHRFTGAPDGSSPYGGLVRDAAGNLYGLTGYGGEGACSDGQGVGCGTIFKVTATGQESVLYSFAGAPDGAYPSAGLAQDVQGTLYGTTDQGGAYGCGTVFKFTP